MAKLTTPHDAERAAAAMMAYMTFLAELPEQAFTLASMRHVAMQERRLMIPDLREVLGPLEAWWREQRPARPALPAPVLRVVERAEPSPEERAAVAAQVRKITEELADRQREPAGATVRANYAPPEVLAQARAALAAKATQ